MSSLLLAALDPARSAVVEACAGSGKTWLLVSRLLRLLLAGAAPGELLAITFTRKAAEEMRSRLDAWLTELAVLPDAAALAFLQERGLSHDEARAALPHARGLLEEVLKAQPGPMITTFHGWFLQVLERAPLPLREAGELTEQTALLREEAWFLYTRGLGDALGSPAEAAFRSLSADLPLASLRDWLLAFLSQRAEWLAYSEGIADPVAHCQRDLEHLLALREDADPLAELFTQPGLRDAAEAYTPLLAREAERLSSLRAAAAALQQALCCWGTDSAFSSLCECLLTKTGGTPRKVSASAATQKQLEGQAERYVALHLQLAEAVQATQEQLAEVAGLRLNRAALTAGQSLLETYTRLKQEQGVIDFTDAELEAAHLLSDEAHAGAVLQKLDTRWKHLLLDEFQDTNPLQWRTLRAWLAAYGTLEAEGSRPTVFMVGDPKQSIYRFRRAEPRLFNAARHWLESHYAAQYLPQNETRRCAPRIVAWVNAVLGQRADYPGFHPHTAHQTTLPGLCECHVAPTAQASEPATDSGTLRLPLRTPPPVQPEKRIHEATWVAKRILEVVGHLRLANGQPARFADITVLYAKRAEIGVFEAAFKQAGIPFLTDRRGELLHTLEVQDVIALLTSLIDPFDNLALAHALKSPLFGLGDAELVSLSRRTEPHWRGRLAAWSEADAPDPVRRAAHLLSSWQSEAGILPVHDLLDHIYHQADALARYAAATPPALRAGVRANLEGLLELSLTQGGGRYPSLPAFLDELRRLRDKAGQEAPNEAPAASGDRVRMLTIHSAKGLESPIVFLIKADARRERTDPYGVLLDWPPDADRPAHFSLHAPKAWRGPGRDALFAAQRAHAEVESLNLLYVAMTRARQALFVSGLASDKPEADPSWLGQLSRALPSAGMEAWPGMEAPAVGVDTPAAPAQARSASPPSPDAPVPALGARRPPASASVRYGIRLHAWLEHLAAGAPLTSLHAAALREGCAEAEAETLKQQVEAIFHHPALRPAFDPEHYLRAHNELEYLDTDGRSARMDRLVEFDDAVWVLDYKSGQLDEPDPARRAVPYLTQMAAYRAAAEALFPGKPVRCVLAFADGLIHWL